MTLPLITGLLGLTMNRPRQRRQKNLPLYLNQRRLNRFRLNLLQQRNRRRPNPPQRRSPPQNRRLNRHQSPRQNRHPNPHHLNRRQLSDSHQIYQTVPHLRDCFYIQRHEDMQKGEIILPFFDSCYVSRVSCPTTYTQTTRTNGLFCAILCVFLYSTQYIVWSQKWPCCYKRSAACRCTGSCSWFPCFFCR